MIGGDVRRLSLHFRAFSRGASGKIHKFQQFKLTGTAIALMWTRGVPSPNTTIGARMKLSRIASATLKAAGAAALVVSMSTAQADIIDFSYNGNLVATMTTGGSTTFVLDFVYAPAGAGTAFINDILMLNTGGATLANSTFTNIGPEQGTASYNAGGFEGGVWNWKVSFPMAGNPGTNRFLEGESTSWSIVSTAPSDWDFGSLHINAFLNGESIKLSGCERGDTSCVPNRVPEPGTLALLGLGLTGLAFVRRRRV